MASLVGTVTPFDSQSQSWEEYCEILQHFFEANEITEATKQKAILLSSVGSQTYSLLRNLLSPVKPGSKTVDELMDLNSISIQNPVKLYNDLNLIQDKEKRGKLCLIMWQY